MSELKIEVDTHTHTVLSGHAYGTLKENAQAACDVGLKGFVCADHGPKIPGAPPQFTLTAVLCGIPEQIEGVRMFPGAEADILDTLGTLDIEDMYLAVTDFVIASLHTITFPPAGKTENTEALLCALANPFVDCIGHPGNPRYPIDARALVLETKRYGKVIEINNHSFGYRHGSDPNCRQIIRLCREHDVPVVVSSDAHSSYAVGHVERALAVLEDEGFAPECILNADFHRFCAYVDSRRRRTA